MLETARFALPLHHDDAEREFAYDDGAEKALAAAEGPRVDGGQHEGGLQDGVLIDSASAQRSGGTHEQKLEGVMRDG